MATVDIGGPFEINSKPCRIEGGAVVSAVGIEDYDWRWIAVGVFAAAIVIGAIVQAIRRKAAG